MSTYTITARNNSNDEIEVYQIRKEGKGFFLYDLFASDKVPVHYYPKTKKHLIEAIECVATIIEVVKF